MYAILDIETTGGKYNEEGITEIAIYRYDGHTVIDQFISLVNPEKPIQDFVVKLTGINNKMLRNAPKFYEIAKRVIEITKDATLVAHNAEFDSRILATEFRRLGFDFKKNTLCTVELSRQLIPGEDSYKLGKLCKSLGIPMSDRHRASGDAIATVQLFKVLLEKDNHKQIVQQLIKYHDQREVKNKLNALIDQIPEKAGVFYIHNKDGRVIYLGKGNNIKGEVTKLFLKQSRRAQKIQERVHEITYETTGNELFTRLKYHLELDALQPKYNFSKKKKGSPNDFAHHNFIIQLKGRTPEEHAVLLVENNEFIGFGYTNLLFQESRLEILRSIITPAKNKELAKRIVKNYMKSHSVGKVIRF